MSSCAPGWCSAFAKERTGDPSTRTHNCVPDKTTRSHTKHGVGKVIFTVVDTWNFHTKLVSYFELYFIMINIGNFDTTLGVYGFIIAEVGNFDKKNSLSLYLLAIIIDFFIENDY